MQENQDEQLQTQTQVTQLLADVRERGGDDASGKLFSLVYDELRRLANLVMRGDLRGQTLQPTALVHEAWMKLVGNLGTVNDRPHFFAVAARAMRQVLANHARDAKRMKRGGEHMTVALRDDHAPSTKQEVDLIALHEALEQLAELNERHARVIELRAFGMMTIDETADMLEVSRETVKRDWTAARAWLSRELRDADQ